MKHVLQNERGMALAIAIVALVIVGALIAGAFFSGTQEQRVAENVRRVQASFGVAEQGIYDIIRNWSDPNNRATYAGLYPYPPVAPSKSTWTILQKTAASKTGSYNGTIMKLNDGLYLIDMTGQDTMSLAGRIRGGGASQRMGLIARIRPLAINIQAAVTSGGTNLVAGNVTIAGNDSVPDGWAGCPPKDSTKAGIRMQVGDSITKSGNARITGQPPVIHDPTLKDSAFSVYGDVTFTQLAAMATIPTKASASVKPRRPTFWPTGRRPERKPAVRRRLMEDRTPASVIEEGPRRLPSSRASSYGVAKAREPPSGSRRRWRFDPLVREREEQPDHDCIGKDR